MFSRVRSIGLLSLVFLTSCGLLEELRILEVRKYQNLCNTGNLAGLQKLHESGAMAEFAKKSFPYEYGSHLAGMAIASKNIEVVRFVFGNGYDKAPAYSPRYLDKAMMGGNKEIIEYIRSLGYGFDPESMNLAFEQWGKDLSFIKYLVELGLDIDYRNGFTKGNALHSAIEGVFMRRRAKNRGVDLVQYCLEQGFSPNEADDNGRTAAHYAAEVCGDKDLFEILLSFGMRLDVVDNEGNTPLDCAKKIWCARKFWSRYIEEQMEAQSLHSPTAGDKPK